MPLKLLAVGDMHLGRQPARLPAELCAEAADVSPAGAWQRLVERAIEAGVDAVAMAGDVVEREEDFYEAYRELSQGVAKLAGSGIHVLGVAGNHDVHVLPRLADQLEDFELIGRGGIWQPYHLEARGEALTLHGWSFRERQVHQSPLAGWQPERGPGPNLGLLHCDLDAPGSPYAPAATAELQNTGLDGWLLGHIHKPHALTRECLLGYLGCVSGVDPGEPGGHGPWLVTIAGGEIQALSQWVLAPLRWDTIELDISTLSTGEQSQALLLEATRKRDEMLAALEQPPLAVGLRVCLTGRSDLGRTAEALLRQNDRAVFHEGAAGTRYFLERCWAETRPAVSLETLAQQSDPPGLLAQRLLMLDQPGAEPTQRLIAEARDRLEGQRRDARWQVLETAPLDDEAVIDWLRQTGTRLLEDMLAQQEGPQ
jgi:DNA repair exonuclease SbcCD nuclease subunit